MEFKGTKGNWEFKDNLPEYHEPKCSRIEVFSKQNPSFWICKVQNNGMIGNEEGKANALLISKAPEMLEMLEDVCENLELQLAMRGGCDADGYGGTHLLEKAKTLIKQATGINEP
ncbi:MAG: hypothetical protein REI96_20650 [Flavobacterium nitrogenifigens]|uniref:hypothetical protein n=1 Tax=Flavobacterium nitrogenifigens TaxID=1617283 RepID=UPI0028099713|nr:hypothetical protein [Flavobacterium nitrogenifigens]MDQ8014870.1 hypothetical protein [Flavobacterium nitrogenifigens]